MVDYADKVLLSMWTQKVIVYCQQKNNGEIFFLSFLVLVDVDYRLKPMVHFNGPLTDIKGTVRPI